jgi:hypothetical protein
VKRCSDCGEPLCDWCSTFHGEHRWPLPEFVRVDDEWQLRTDFSGTYRTCDNCYPIHAAMVTILERAGERDDWTALLREVLDDAASPVAFNKVVRTCAALIEPTTEH